MGRTTSTISTGLASSDESDRLRFDPAATRLDFPSSFIAAQQASNKSIGDLPS